MERRYGRFGILLWVQGSVNVECHYRCARRWEALSVLSVLPGEQRRVLGREERGKFAALDGSRTRIAEVTRCPAN